MIYVYILECDAGEEQEHFYVGVTEHLRARIRAHNSGEVSHTSQYGPWKLKNYFAFDDDKKAYAFEKYLKSGSGRAFAKKHF